MNRLWNNGPAVICGLVTSCLLLGLQPVNSEDLPVVTDGPSFAQPESADSPLVHLLGSSLVRLDDNGHLRGVDRSELKDIKYFAFYYSAAWCPSCRQFTPDLIRFYNAFHSKHPNFEIVLVSNDGSADDMLNYMTSENMPWMAIRYDKLLNNSLHDIIQCGGKTIPSLVLIDETGQVRSDTYVKNQYMGPQRVVEDIPKIVP